MCRCEKQVCFVEAPVKGLFFPMKKSIGKPVLSNNLVLGGDGQKRDLSVGWSLSLSIYSFEASVVFRTSVFHRKGIDVKSIFPSFHLFFC